MPAADLALEQRRDRAKSPGPRPTKPFGYRCIIRVLPSVDCIPAQELRQLSVMRDSSGLGTGCVLFFKNCLTIALDVRMIDNR